MKEKAEEGMEEEMKDEVKEEIKEEKMEDTMIKEKAQRMTPTPGELMVLRAIRNGAYTNTKIQKNFGPGIAKEIINDFMNMAVRGNFAILSNGKYFLSPKGVNAVLKHELEKPSRFPAKTKEVVADKVVGGILIAMGVIILIIGFQFAMGIFNTVMPQMSSPPSDFTLNQIISYFLEFLVKAYTLVGFQFLGTLLIIWIGGSVLSKGVALFRR